MKESIYNNKRYFLISFFLILVITSKTIGNFEIPTSLEDVQDCGLEFKIKKTPATCKNVQDGAISLSVLGGCPPIKFYVNTELQSTTENQYSISLIGLSSGNYHVLVIDGKGCKLDKSIALPHVSNMKLSPTFYHISCKNAVDGKIDLGLKEKDNSYSVQWDDSFDGTLRNGLGPGDYSVTISDAYGCVDSLSFKLREPNDVAYSVNVFQDCNRAKEQNVEVITENLKNIQCVWDDGEEGRKRFLKPGEHTFKLVDKDNCTTGKIEVPPVKTISIDAVELSAFKGGNISRKGANDGWISFQIKNGTPPYRVSHANEITITNQNVRLDNLSEGAHQVLVEDGKGCNQDFAFELEAPQALLVDILKSNYASFNLKCYGDSTGSIEVKPLGGVSPYQVRWYKEGEKLGEGPLLSGLTAGNYEVQVEDMMGSKITSKVYLDSPKRMRITKKKKVINGSGSLKKRKNKKKNGTELIIEDSNDCQCTRFFPKRKKRKKKPKGKRKAKKKGKKYKGQCPKIN